MNFDRRAVVLSDIRSRSFSKVWSDMLQELCELYDTLIALARSEQESLINSQIQSIQSNIEQKQYVLAQIEAADHEFRYFSLEFIRGFGFERFVEVIDWFRRSGSQAEVQFAAEADKYRGLLIEQLLLVETLTNQNATLINQGLMYIQELRHRLQPELAQGVTYDKLGRKEQINSEKSKIERCF